jgi:uncharacterized protein YxjI|tara:strand:+ start:72 stop:572 length:501 start_codon:yes stop_codon:yes gene_type:complete
MFERKVFLLRQKILTVGDKYDIMDQDGGIIGKAKVKFLSLSPKITVFDNSDHEVLRIDGNLMRTKFNVIGQNGTSVCLITRRLIAIRPSLEVEDSDGQTMFKGTGDFTRHDFSLKDKNDVTVVKVHEKWLSITDSYAAELTGEVDPRIALSFVLAVDQAYKKGRRR